MGEGGCSADARDRGCCRKAHRDAGRARRGRVSKSGPNAGRDPTDPLVKYLPTVVDDYYDESFWYEAQSVVDDTLGPACPLLLTITTEVHARLQEDPLFWGVLGRVYEPFALGNPKELETRITSVMSDVLAARISTGYADLLDYMNYFEECRSFGDDSLETEYQSFLAAVEQASPAECEALFSKLEQLNYGPNKRPPRPAEEHLPIADKLWGTVLGQRDLSVGLLARAGLFYWLCRDPARAPLPALIALGRECEGDCFEFWRIPPFLPFWAASRRAAMEADWTLAALCWKRTLVDIVLFAGALGPEQQDQVHAFPFDPRFVKDIYLHSADAERPAMLHLALGHALDGLRRSSLTEWSQVYLVLSELSRRLGVRACSVAGVADLLGTELYSRIDHETGRFIAEAEHAWSYEAQTIDDSTDYVLIGLNYRRAIENEWRLRLASALAMLDTNIEPDRATLGEMLRVLRKPGSIGQQLLRHKLAAVISPDSRIFDQLFLKRASELVRDYLNIGPHRHLGHNACLALRNQLLNGRMLHDLLACVQPPDGR